MGNYLFAESAFQEYLEWQKEDRKTLHRINNLLKAINRDPFHGEGKPEPLKGGNWSRRINEKDRLVYSVEKDIVYIKQCKGHYKDR